METAIQKRLAIKIKTLREKLKITQEELASLSGIEYKYIQRIESKKPPIVRIDTVERLAKALESTPSELLNFK